MSGKRQFSIGALLIVVVGVMLCGWRPQAARASEPLDPEDIPKFVEPLVIPPEMPPTGCLSPPVGCQERRGILRPEHEQDRLAMQAVLRRLVA